MKNQEKVILFDNKCKAFIKAMLSLPSTVSLSKTTENNNNTLYLR